MGDTLSISSLMKPFKSGVVFITIYGFQTLLLLVFTSESHIQHPFEIHFKLIYKNNVSS